MSTTYMDLYLETQPSEGLTINLLNSHETINHTFMRNRMNTPGPLDLNIYDNESYFKEPKTATTYLNLNTIQDPVIEILEHEYEKRELGYKLKQFEYPHASLTWRNAICFLGRILDGDEVAYKGIITLQYDGENYHVIVQKPHQPNIGSFSNQDPLSIAYNALDPKPFIFEDYYGEDALQFRGPTVLGVLLYDRFFPPISPSSRAQTFSRVSREQEMFVRPYIASPPLYRFEAEQAVSYISCTLELSLGTNLEEDNIIGRYELARDNKLHNHLAFPISVFNEPDQDLQNLLYQTFDLSRAHNKSIRAVIKTRIIEDDTNIIEYEEHNKVTVDFVNSVDLTFLFDNNHDIINPPLRYRVSVDTEEGLAEFGGSPHTVARVNIINQTTGESKDFIRRFDTPSEVGDTISFVFRFEGVDFTIPVWDGQSVTGHTYDELVTINLTDSFYHMSMGSSQPLMVTGEQKIDPQDMLQNHRIHDATHMALYDRFVILYGPHMGSNFIQFLEYDKLNHAPFPFYSMDFDGAVQHVHRHRNSLYIFTNEGLYILHSGITPVDMVKTLAYPSSKIDPTYKNTIVSFGNEVFFLESGTGYVVRTNINVESQDDVYTTQVTPPLGELLKDPREFVKQRFEEGYGLPTDVGVELDVEYRTHSTTNEIYLFASYTGRWVKDEIPHKRELMVVYHFSKETRRWSIYDTILGSRPVFFNTSSNALGFDMVLLNDSVNPYLTVGSFVHTLPTNYKDKLYSDVKSSFFNVGMGEHYYLIDEEDNYYIKPLSIMFDTGLQAFSPKHNKKFRRVLNTFTNVEGDVFNFFMVPYVDNLEYARRLNVDVETDMAGGIEAQFTENLFSLGFHYSSLVPVAKSHSEYIQGYRVGLPGLQSTKKLDVLTQFNIRGKVMGYRLYIIADAKFNVGEYGIIFRQQKAR